MGKSYRAEKYAGDGFRSNKGSHKFKKNNNNNSVHYTRTKPNKTSQKNVDNDFYFESVDNY